MSNSSKFLAKELKPLIVQLRRQTNSKEDWATFRQLVTNNLDEICSKLDTRWLVSIADTYADYGSEIEKRNALYISLIANFEKLWATQLLMYDLKLNKERLDRLKNNETIALWDGMYSFNINRGDMTRNLFGRLFEFQKTTPELEKILLTVLNRLSQNETTLKNLSIYHKRLMTPIKKRSLLKVILRKAQRFFKQYRLFCC